MGNSNFRVIKETITYKKAFAFKYRCSFTVWYTDSDCKPMTRHVDGLGNTKCDALASAYDELLRHIDLIQLEMAS